MPRRDRTPQQPTPEQIQEQNEAHQRAIMEDQARVATGRRSRLPIQIGTPLFEDPQERPSYFSRASVLARSYERDAIKREQEKEFLNERCEDPKDTP